MGVLDTCAKYFLFLSNILIFVSCKNDLNEYLNNEKCNYVHLSGFTLNPSDINTTYKMMINDIKIYRQF